MCGISAVSANFPSNKIVEYEANIIRYLTDRGCGDDSYGLVSLNGKVFTECKGLGEIPGAAQVALSHKFTTQMVLGHTRAATTGAITLKNAHPFINEDNTLALSHNGIIFGYAAVKHRQTEAGHIFRSSTDSEILLHGFEDAIKPLKSDRNLYRNTANALIAMIKEYGAANSNMVYASNGGLITAYSGGRLSFHADTKKYPDGFEAKIATLATEDATEGAWEDLPKGTVIILLNGTVLFRQKFAVKEETFTSNQTGLGDVYSWQRDWGSWRNDHDRNFLNGVASDNVDDHLDNLGVDEDYVRGKWREYIQNEGQGKYVRCEPYRGKPHEVRFQRAKWCPNCEAFYCKGHDKAHQHNVSQYICALGGGRN